ncbi:MAG: glycogen synthase GlgA [Puniceicoccales bacterium]|jgi:starch synthase|nr:glycogen synthase GlgA [Puniceicoccales bacterium]
MFFVHLSKLKILMVASEAAPFAKAGGLGDVVSSLADSLAALGHDVRVLLPLYFLIPQDLKQGFHPLPGVISVHLGQEHWARLWEFVPANGPRYYFIEYDHFFFRDRLYDGPYGGFEDNPQRFAFLCRAAIDLPEFLQWIPDIYHVHDWMAALVPVYLETVARRGPLAHTGSVLTIHNLQHQGYAHQSIIDYAGLPWGLWQSDKLEACGGVNFLKGGIYFANKLTTVSPTYAEEIRTPAFGCGLEDIFRFRGGDLVGILNGIDENLWNPATDPTLPANYDRNNLEKKSLCKMNFCQQRFGDAKSDNRPLFVAISRLYAQKGLDVLADILPWVVETMSVRFAILGCGEWLLEEHLASIAHRSPDRIWFYRGYDETLAHQMTAAADFFVMPSRFEPCGLTQLYSMRYGTLPIVHATGGLKDSVVSRAHGVERATGFVFNDLTHQALYSAIGWACATYYDHPSEILTMRQNGMCRDFSWKQSSRRYLECYHWAMEKKMGFP